MDNLSVFLVDDHAVVRLGLITFLEDIPWVEIAGEAGSAAQAVEAVGKLQPDVVLMDVRLPDGSGIVACNTITRRWPQVRVMMLTSYADDKLIRQAQLAGACCYIPKVVGNQALLEALEKARDGELDLDPRATQESIEQYHRDMRARGSRKFKDLSDREMRILVAITEGKTNAQIAQALVVSEQTVTNALNAIVRKLGVDNRFEAAIYANRYNARSYLPEETE